MEYCEKIFGNSMIKKRVERLVCVLVMTMLIVGNAANLQVVEYADADEVYESAFETHFGKEIESTAAGVRIPRDMIDTVMSKSMESASNNLLTDKIPTANEVDTEAGTSELPLWAGIDTSDWFSENFVPVDPDVPIIPDAPIIPETPNVSEIPIIPEKPSIPEIPSNPETPIVPENPSIPETPDIPVSPVAPIVPENPVAPPETTVPGTGETPGDGSIDSGAGITSSFLINANGMIYGYSPGTDVKESGGILRLPSEGCTGIVKGAFAGNGAGIFELCIPPNITNIELGALNDLTELEYIETEDENPNYASFTGFLLDKSMTTLLQVPSGLTSLIMLPNFITRLEAYSMGSLQYSGVDIHGCGLIEVSENVFGDNGANGLTFYVQRQYTQEYREMLEPLGATVVSDKPVGGWGPDS